MFNVKKTKTSFKKAVCGTLTVMMAFTSIPLTSFAAGAKDKVTKDLLDISGESISNTVYDGQKITSPTANKLTTVTGRNAYQGALTVEIYKDNVKVNDIKDAGSYVVKVNCQGDVNYEPTTLEISKFTIDKKEAGIDSVQVSSKEYDGKNTVTGFDAKNIKINNIIPGDTVNAKSANVEWSGVNARTRTVNIKNVVLDNSNYKVSDKTDFSVFDANGNPVEITPTTKAPDYTYAAGETSVEAEYKTSASALNLAAGWSIIDTNSLNAKLQEKGNIYRRGTNEVLIPVKVKYTPANDPTAVASNYSATANLTKTIKVKVTERMLDASKFEMYSLASREYDPNFNIYDVLKFKCTEPALTSTFNTKDLSVEFYTYDANRKEVPVEKPKNVGTYFVKIVGFTNDTYGIPDGGLKNDASWNFTITPKTLKAEDVKLVSKQARYNAKEQSAQFELANVAKEFKNDIKADEFVTNYNYEDGSIVRPENGNYDPATGVKNIGKYTVRIVELKNNNYKLANNSQLEDSDWTFEIVKTVLTADDFTVAPVSVKIGEKMPEVTYKINPSFDKLLEELGNGNITISYVDVNDPSVVLNAVSTDKVGNYLVQLNVKGNDKVEAVKLTKDAWKVSVSEPTPDPVPATPDNNNGSVADNGNNGTVAENGNNNAAEENGNNVPAGENVATEGNAYLEGAQTTGESANYAVGLSMTLMIAAAGMIMITKRRFDK